MFGYHFNLTGRARQRLAVVELAARPQADLVLTATRSTTSWIAVIYNGGNPVLFWAGVPALAVVRRAGLDAALAGRSCSSWPPSPSSSCRGSASSAPPSRTTTSPRWCSRWSRSPTASTSSSRRPAWRDLAIGYLVLVVVAGMLIFPLGSALPMPDWYINAARALPPWNFGFQFPDPPTG